MTEPRETAEQLAAWLLTIDEEEFRRIVARDVNKRLDPEGAAALRHPSVLIRWVQALKVLLRDIHVQMAEKARDPERAEWRVKAARFEVSIQAAQAEARALVRRHQAEAQAAESLRDKRARGDARDAAITRLIAAHRDEFNRLIDEERERVGIQRPVRAGRTECQPFRQSPPEDQEAGQP
jgi:hypothetical protein